MFEKLNEDIYIYLSNYLTLQDIVNLKQVNKELDKIFDNNYFKEYACFLYSKEFWKKAKERNTKISNPLPNFQQELLRIEKFNNCLVLENQNPWTEKDFFDYWEAIENYFNKKNN